ncbi:helix-turn-helix domain-containing protein [Aliiglaciecola sp. CAU 1673]|uniref:GlxA family transcriptional regulator n=1 Tax=Aliiglaciecola sp. CAU 1673 TaxID=3032595 RepID=UPI0023DC6ADD|nr:helix-turn-helix domain-containing protein [Aliiglaciecola sp. CAU 1673]MDF2179075.1 helix-turn-helix domain-containing protein [Aliiglaciecola sp. CAU 1673]
MTPKKIAILATDNAMGSTLMAAVDFFAFANSFWRYLHPLEQQVPFETAVYKAGGGNIQCSNGFVLPCQDLSALKDADALISVAAYTYDKGGFREYLTELQPALSTLREAKARGTWLVSHCTGTFSLGEAGVLDNEQATSCWWMKDIFSERYPKVHLRMDEIVVTSNRVITGGATTSFPNVCLKLLEELIGVQFANGLGKLMLLDRQRLSQQTFMDPTLVIRHRDSLIEQVQDWMLANYAEQVSLDALCDKFAVTKRTLIRRFKAATGETPLAYLQQVRVEQAKNLLAGTDMPVERIVEKVGYGDPASFRKLFVAQTQLTPKAYRQRFSYLPALSA